MAIFSFLAMPRIEITLTAGQAVHFEGDKIVIIEKAIEWAAPPFEVVPANRRETPTKKRPKTKPTSALVTGRFA